MGGTMHRKNRREKQAYKRKVGFCQHPSCPRDGPNKIEKGYEVCYHVERAKKLNSKLVANTKTAKPLIDAELVGTRVLCVNCHRERNPMDVVGCRSAGAVRSSRKEMSDADKDDRPKTPPTKPDPTDPPPAPKRPTKHAVGGLGKKGQPRCL